MTTVVEPRKSMEPELRDEVLYYPHQIEGVRKLYHWRSFLLADDMGLGKSLQALTVFIMDIKKKRGDKCIVICPTTLKGNWADEIEKFTRLPYVILGQEEKNGKMKSLGPVGRKEQLEEFDKMIGPKVLITNYEQITAHVDRLNQMNFHVAIYDEAHYIKNPKSQRTKASHKLRATRNFMLTGSPMLNHVNELWSLLNKIAPSRYPSYWNFVHRYCVFGGYKNKQIIAPKNEKELTEQLQSVMLRRLKKDVLDLPEVQIIQRKVDLSTEQQALYDEVEDNLQIQMPDEPDPVDIENALTKFLRLKQICATTEPFTGEDKSAKLDLVVEDATQLIEEGHRLVIFTQFRSVIACLEERFKDLGAPIFTLHGDIPQIDRQPTVRRWSESEGGILICMLQVAGIGLNMTASRHGMFVDKLFVPMMNQQAIDRLNRIGADETQAIQIYEYICRRTIENRIEQILRVKSKLFNSIVETGDFKKKLIAALMAKDE